MFAYFTFEVFFYFSLHTLCLAVVCQDHKSEERERERERRALMQNFLTKHIKKIGWYSRLSHNLLSFLFPALTIIIGSLFCNRQIFSGRMLGIALS